MKRFVVLVVLSLLSAAFLSGGTSSAQSAAHNDWEWSNQGRQVLIQDTEPTAADPRVHVKFKRYGGDGQRQVRILERQMRPATPWIVHKPEKLQIGEKAVFTTEGVLPCEPAKRPLVVLEQMRVKIPGKPWEHWVTWVSRTDVILDCTEDE